jgi:hypothetical protein
MGGAQNALGSSTGALYMNPANLAVTRVYHFEANAAFNPQGRRQSYGGAVADSSTGALAGGFAGTWNIEDPGQEHRTWTDLRGSLAYALSQRFAFGATARYLRVGQSIASGPFGGSLISDGTPGEPLVNSITFDVGATLMPADGVRIGVVGHNLTAPQHQLAPTTVAGGVGYSNDLVAAEADLLTDFTTYSSVKERVMIGGELFLAGHVPLRAGYRYDDGTRTHAISGGIGYVDKRFSLEGSVRQDVVGDNPATMLAFAFRYFYDASGASHDDGGGDGL